MAIDITIRGAGIFGLSVAFACLERGAGVRVIDPGDPGAGASGGIVGALAPHVPETWNPKKAAQLDSLLMARTFWPRVAELSGQETGYGVTGRLQPIPDAAALALAEARAVGARELWRGEAIWEVVSDPGPLAPPSPTGLWIRDTLSARLHPRRATSALAGACAALGADIVTEGAEEGQVVWATGAADLAETGLGQGIKGQAALLDFAAPEAPQLFVDGLHIVPHADGTTAIGSTTEREAEDLGTDGQLDALIGTARAALPALAHAPVLERWAGLRPRTRSRAPILGPHPARPGAWIANGGFKIGFGMAPLVGELMADLLLDGRDRIPDLFRSRPTG